MDRVLVAPPGTPDAEQEARRRICRQVAELLQRDEARRLVIDRDEIRPYLPPRPTQPSRAMERD